MNSQNLCFSIFMFLTLAAVTLAIRPVAAVEIHVPGDYATIQEGLDAACASFDSEKVVRVAAGVYHEDLRIRCGLRLLGENKATTIIDGTGFGGTPPPADCGVPVFQNAIPPLVVVSPPHSILDVTDPCTRPEGEFFPNGLPDPAEIAHFTIKQDDQFNKPSPSAPFPQVGVSMVWSNDAHLHDLKISGFIFGIAINRSDGTEIDNVDINAFTNAIFFREFGTGINNIWEIKRHTLGGNVHHSFLHDSFRGIRAENVIDATFHQNIFQNISSRGIQLRGVSDSNIHHNRFCQTSAEIQYISPIFTPLENLNSGDILHHNLADGPESLFQILFNDPLATGNVDFQNEVDPALDCSA